MSRLVSEQAFHDAQAARRRLALGPSDLIVDDDAYLDHETWIRPAMDRLGDVNGRRVLDLGCGHGMASVVLARRGGIVTSVDLSSGYLAEAEARGRANQVAFDVVQADAEHLPFPDGGFDCIWGNAILHHLDIRQAAREIERVLAPGGLAVFCEPWGDNPLLRWARRWGPYPGKERTVDEEPLRSDCLPVLRERFPRLDVHGYQLFGMARRVWSQKQWTNGLDRVDNIVLRLAAPLRSWCRYMVLALPRNGEVLSQVPEK